AVAGGPSDREQVGGAAGTQPRRRRGTVRSVASAGHRPTLPSPHHAVRHSPPAYPESVRGHVRGAGAPARRACVRPAYGCRGPCGCRRAAGPQPLPSGAGRGRLTPPHRAPEMEGEMRTHRRLGTAILALCLTTTAVASCSSAEEEARELLDAFLAGWPTGELDQVP